MTHAKPIDELNRDDLQQSPIWTYASDAEDEHDETYVVAVNASEVPNAGDYSVYQVACDITTRAGVRHLGIIEVCNGEIDDPMPIVVGRTGEYFPLVYPPDRRSRAQFDAFFGGDPTQLYPLHWRLRVRIRGETEVREGNYADRSRG